MRIKNMKDDEREVLRKNESKRKQILVEKMTIAEKQMYLFQKAGNKQMRIKNMTDDEREVLRKNESKK